VNPVTSTSNTRPVRFVDAVPDRFDAEVRRRVDAGARFAGLYATADRGDGGTRLTAVLVEDGALTALDAPLPVAAGSYPSVTALLPAAFWYERELHDLFGLVPVGHPRLDPLVLPLADGAERPCPGSGRSPGRLDPDDLVLPRRVTGSGMFTIPHGPVRSGVFESVEYLVETPGEDVAHIQVRVYAKHRGIEKRFEGMAPAAGILLAERVEGIASVAHALAFAQACETLADAAAPPAAAYIRVLHAELERLANHLDVTTRLCDAAGLAVATSRFAWHKELVLRLVGSLCGSRFGRGVVTPGGAHRIPLIPPAQALADLAAIEHTLLPDARLLMNTSSFLDRLRGTGRLDPDLARAHGALGPVGRASGLADDARRSRPYDAYDRLDLPPARTHDTADVLARTRIRFDEIDAAVSLARQALTMLQTLDPDTTPVCVPVHLADGRALARVEAPQGELLYALELAGGAITRCKPRTASFHNLVLFHETFHTDILTDYPFIEASFGLSIAGVVS
jgi:Ni,Fe-hydrogenase III large subunit